MGFHLRIPISLAQEMSTFIILEPHSKETEAKPHLEKLQKISFRLNSIRSQKLKSLFR